MDSFIEVFDNKKHPIKYKGDNIEKIIETVAIKYGVLDEKPRRRGGRGRGKR